MQKLTYKVKKMVGIHARPASALAQFARMYQTFGNIFIVAIIENDDCMTICIPHGRSMHTIIHIITNI